MTARTVPGAYAYRTVSYYSLMTNLEIDHS